MIKLNSSEICTGPNFERTDFFKLNLFDTYHVAKRAKRYCQIQKSVHYSSCLLWPVSWSKVGNKEL